MKIKSSKTNKQMAKVFKKTGKWFLALPEEAEVDMEQRYSTVEIETCNAAASFGGWLAVMYNTDNECSVREGEILGRDYADGAIIFARKLGFINGIELANYMDKKSEIWGNRWGGSMFSEPFAFNEGDKIYDKRDITTKAIGEKLIAVAQRLAKSKKGV